MARHETFAHLNFSLGKCYFHSNDSLYQIAMAQYIFLDDYSTFIKSGQAQYHLSAYFGGNGHCKNGSIEILLTSDDYPNFMSISAPRKCKKETGISESLVRFSSSFRYHSWSDGMALPREDECNSCRRKTNYDGGGF